MHTGEQVADRSAPAELSRGGAEDRGPYQLLQDCLADLAGAGGVAAPDAPWQDTAVWATCHGFASLRLDSPVSRLDDSAADAAAERLLDLVVAGLATAG